MSKRDTFVTNVKSLTRSRSMPRALKGWEVAKLISLPANVAHASCELCGTPFRNGAFVTHDRRNNVRIAVGGTCLETIQRARFADKKLIQRRKKSTLATLERRYLAIVDPGSWINWIVEHAPTRLAPIVADLRFFDMVSTDDDLEKLIRFHDKTRRYPTAALIPAAVGANQVPSEMTLDEARKFLERLDENILRAITDSAYARYLRDEFRPGIGGDVSCLGMWEALPDPTRRMVVLLARLTDRFVTGEIVEMPVDVQPISFPLRTPAFIWHKTFGLGYLDEQEQTYINGGAQSVWLWSEAGYRRNDVRYWQSVMPTTTEAVERAQLAAFWSSPVWFIPRKAAKKSVSAKAGR